MFIVKVLEFNIEHGGESYGIDKAIDLIYSSNINIAILLETQTNKGFDQSNTIKQTLIEKTNKEWYCIPNLGNYGAAIISIWPLEILNTKYGIVKVIPPSFIPFLVIGVHLSDFPYQPFQITNIEYCYDTCQIQFVKNVKDIIRFANIARGDEINKILKMVSKLKNQYDNIIIGGDFNEPSHLDWTSRAVLEGLVPKKILFPTSIKLFNNNFKDTYRTIYPNEVKYPGYTWPNDDTKGRSDRIDFIYTSPNIEIINCDILSQSPSDHKAIISTILLCPISPSI